MRSGICVALAAFLMVALTGAEADEADICRELAAYAESAATDSAPQGKAGPDPGDIRRDGQATGTQGGGSAAQESSSNTRGQSAAPPNAPASNGAAPEPATSPHASNSSNTAANDEPWRQPEQLLAVVRRGDAQACRQTAQKLRRAGADLPASLIALAAYTKREGATNK